jgi:hypothetical protein
MWNVEDATPEEAGCEENVRLGLVDKLHRLELHEHAALVDAVERYWNAVSCAVPVDPARILDAMDED